MKKRRGDKKVRKKDMENILVFPKKKKMEKLPQVREAAEEEEKLLEELFKLLDYSGVPRASRGGICAAPKARGLTGPSARGGICAAPNARGLTGPSARACFAQMQGTRSST
eukprot:COSAG02_NODE_6200_length_3733_cov_3.467125_4_plen_111_part_00